MGCPNFLSASFRNRASIALSIKLCLNCLDPKITYSKNHNAACDIKLKAELQCKSQGCKRNVWLCDQHKHEPANAVVIKKMKDTVARQGWTLGMVSVMSPKPSPASSPSPKRRSKKSKISESPKTANKAQLGKPESTAVGEEAVEELRISLETKGITVEEEPRGRPMFQFFLAKGKTKPVMTFMDSGCSDAVFREGVPGVQWEGAVTRAGPFPMGGVGGMEALTRDEWKVFMPLVNGACAEVRGHSMTKVTGDFPQVNIERAVEAVKEDAPHKAELQRAKLPSVIGGEVDVLL